jgi:hypothetical protein
MKRKWIHDFNESCAQHGEYVLARDLLNDPVKFQSYHRMFPESYKKLLLAEQVHFNINLFVLYVSESRLVRNELMPTVCNS